jgi:hypothetical protein
VFCLIVPGFPKIMDKTRYSLLRENDTEIKYKIPASGQKTRRTRQHGLARGGNFSSAWFALRNEAPFIAWFSSTSLLYNIAPCVTGAWV